MQYDANHSEAARTPGPEETDADILRDAEAGKPLPDDLARLRVGALVYASDGQQVAVVEAVSPEHVIVRAGQPGRPIELMPWPVGQVSADGRRLELDASSEAIEQLVGHDQPGYRHLQAQRLGDEPPDAPDAERGEPSAP